MKFPCIVDRVIGSMKNGWSHKLLPNVFHHNLEPSHLEVIMALGVSLNL